MSGLTLVEFSDREFLAVIADTLEDGTTTVVRVTERMNLSTPRPQANVASRMGWMRRFGVLERLNRLDWTLSDFGVALTNGKLSKTLAERIDRMEAEQMVTLLQDFAARRYLSSEVSEAHMMRRAWVYGTHPLRRQR